MRLLKLMLKLYININHVNKGMHAISIICAKILNLWSKNL